MEYFKGMKDEIEFLLDFQIFYHFISEFRQIFSLEIFHFLPVLVPYVPSNPQNIH